MSPSSSKRILRAPDVGVGAGASQQTFGLGDVSAGHCADERGIVNLVEGGEVYDVAPAFQHVEDLVEAEGAAVGRLVGLNEAEDQAIVVEQSSTGVATSDQRRFEDDGAVRDVGDGIGTNGSSPGDSIGIADREDIIASLGAAWEGQPGEGEGTGVDALGGEIADAEDGEVEGGVEMFGKLDWEVFAGRHSQARREVGCGDAAGADDVIGGDDIEGILFAREDDASAKGWGVGEGSVQDDDGVEVVGVRGGTVGTQKAGEETQSAKDTFHRRTPNQRKAAAAMPKR